jgi:hypothetical protein
MRGDVRGRGRRWHLKTNKPASLAEEERSALAWGKQSKRAREAGQRATREQEEPERVAALGEWREEARVWFWALLLSRKGAAHRAEEARIMR